LNFMSKDVEFNSLLEKIVLKLDTFKDKEKIEKYIASLTYNSFATRPKLIRIVFKQNL